MAPPASEARKGLPSDFVFGFATAAYQIEGGANDGGRGPCIWDTFTHLEPSRTSGVNGDVACDHYHRFEEDLDLLAKYGAKAYRFSISWSRIIPLGGREDPVNEEGIAFYNKLIDGLLARGITPWITLYHWDLPQALHDRYGGWLNVEEIQKDFERYARLCYERFGNRTKNWITLNEPWVVSIHVSSQSSLLHFSSPPLLFPNSPALNPKATKMLMKLQGYSIGIDAPGRSSTNKACTEGDSTREPWVVAKALIMSHARAASLYNKEFRPKQGGRIGVSLSGDFFEPWDPEEPRDREAAERRMEFQFGWFANPMM